MQENKNRLLIIMLIGALTIGNVFFGLNYFLTRQELQEIKHIQGDVELNTKILNFTSMFIKKVLQAEQEVDFETRLSLENSVRDLKDEEVMAEWQKFIGSSTEAEAQNSVKSLLGLLVSKIQK